MIDICYCSSSLLTLVKIQMFIILVHSALNNVNKYNLDFNNVLVNVGINIRLINAVKYCSFLVHVK